MVNEEREDDDPVWQQAVDWIMSEHEGRLDEHGRNALRAWLAESSTHRDAYEEAGRLWLLTGLIPFADDVD